MRLVLEFYIEEALGIEDLDDFSDQIREVIDEKIAETDYMVQDIGINLHTDE